MRLFLLPLLAGWAMSLPQTRFLHEIVQGRCFEVAMSMDGDNENNINCAPVVGGFLAPTESRLEEQITIHDYDMFLSQLPWDETVSRHGNFWILSNSESSHQLTIEGSPQDTLPAKMIRNLQFCGVDKHSNCPQWQSPIELDDGTISWIGAMPSVWANIYQHFSKSLETFTVVVTDDTTNGKDEKYQQALDLFLYAALPYFADTTQSASIVYIVHNEDESACNDAIAVKTIQDALNRIGITSTCQIDRFGLFAQNCIPNDDTMACRAVQKFEKYYSYNRNNKTPTTRKRISPMILAESSSADASTRNSDNAITLLEDDDYDSQQPPGNSDNAITLLEDDDYESQSPNDNSDNAISLLEDDDYEPQPSGKNNDILIIILLFVLIIGGGYAYVKSQNENYTILPEALLPTTNNNKPPEQ